MVRWRSPCGCGLGCDLWAALGADPLAGALRVTGFWLASANAASLLLGLCPLHIADIVMRVYGCHYIGHGPACCRTWKHGCIDHWMKREPRGVIPRRRRTWLWMKRHGSKPQCTGLGGIGEVSIARFFRWIDDFYKFFDALTSNTGGALQVFTCVSALAKAIFILANNFYWLMSFKLAGPSAGWLTFVDPKKWKLWSARIRMVEIFSGLAVQQLVTLRCNRILAQAATADSASKADKAVSRTSTSAVGTELASAAAGSDKTVAAARAKRRSASFRTGVYLLNIVTYGDTSGLLKAVFGRSVNEG